MIVRPNRAAYVDPIMINADQIRAARALLKWTQSKLAKESGVSVAALKKIQGGANTRTVTLKAIQTALEKGGVIFLEAGARRDGGPGVRLK